MLNLVVPTVASIDAELARRRKAFADDLDDLPELTRVASRLEPSARRAFEEAIRTHADRAVIARLEEAVRAAAVDEVVGVLNVLGMADDLREAMSATITRALAGGATVGAQATDGAVTISTAFDMINAHAVQWAAERSATLITAITDTQRANVRELVAQSVGGRRDVRATARLLRDTLGLTERQTVAVARFRARLESDGVAADVLDRRANRYAQAQLRYRAEVVARTEVMDAANEGQQALWREAKNRGTLNPQRTRRVWIATMDERLCPACEPLDETTAPLEGPFPGGVFRPPLHAQCRCTTGLKFVNE